MRSLLLTTALFVPISLSGAIAQGAQEPAISPEAQDPAVAQDEATPGAPDPAIAQEDAAPDQMLTDDAATDAPPAPVAEAEADATTEASVAGAIVRQQAPSELRVDWITGTTVMSPDGEGIGQVRDVIIDQDSKQITAAIVSVGGFLGMGAKEIAVFFDEMQIDYDAREITMAMTREEADAAPAYEFRERAEAPMPEPLDAQPAIGGPEDPALQQ